MAPASTAIPGMITAAALAAFTVGAAALCDVYEDRVVLLVCIQKEAKFFNNIFIFFPPFSFLLPLFSFPKIISTTTIITTTQNNHSLLTRVDAPANFSNPAVNVN